MRYRRFGSTDLETSEIGVGCAGIGGLVSRGVTDAEQIHMLQAAFAAGLRFFDTADIYAQGKSEVLLGRALVKHRDQVVIATKCGYRLPAQQRLMSRVKPLLKPMVRRLGIRRPTTMTSGSLSHDFSPAYISAAVEASLRRLQTDYIDIYQLHSPPLSALQQDDVFDVMALLRDQGKIRYFGVAAERVEPALLSTFESGVRSLQLFFSVLYPNALDQILPRASVAGVGVIARSCFAAGLLNDSLTVEHLRAHTPQWQDVLTLRQRAQTLGRPLMEVALQFNLSIPSISVTILGMRSSAHLEQNLSFYRSGPLTDDDVRELSTRPGPSSWT